MGEEHPGQESVFSVLMNNPSYGLLLHAHLWRSLGAMASFIATIALLQELSLPHQRLWLFGLLLLSRQLPIFLTSLTTGLLPPSCKRTLNMLMTDLLAALAVLVLSTISRPSQVPSVFYLVLMQRTLGAMFDSARRSLLSVKVEAEHARGAVALDSLAWSLAFAVGAAVGGLLLVRWGTSACFLLDALARVVSTTVVFLCVKDRPARWRKVRSMGEDDDEEEDDEDEEEDEEEWPGWERKEEDADLQLSPLPPTPPVLRSSNGATLRAALVHVLSDKGLLRLCLIKATAAAVWGAAELLICRQSEVSEYGVEASAVLLASVGLACSLGRVLAAGLGQQDTTMTTATGTTTGKLPPCLFHSVVSGFLLSAAGSMALACSSSITALFLSSLLRAAGSCLVWIPTTTLLLHGSAAEPAAALQRVRIFDGAACQACRVVGLLVALVLCESFDPSTAHAWQGLAMASLVPAAIWLYALPKPPLSQPLGSSGAKGLKSMELVTSSRRTSGSRRVPKARAKQYPWMSLPPVPEEEEAEEDDEPETSDKRGGQKAAAAAGLEGDFV